MYSECRTPSKLSFFALPPPSLLICWLCGFVWSCLCSSLGKQKKTRCQTVFLQALCFICFLFSSGHQRTSFPMHCGPQCALCATLHCTTSERKKKTTGARPFRGIRLNIIEDPPRESVRLFKCIPKGQEVGMLYTTATRKLNVMISMVLGHAPSHKRLRAIKLMLDIAMQCRAPEALLRKCNKHRKHRDYWATTGWHGLWTAKREKKRKGRRFFVLHAWKTSKKSEDPTGHLKE